MPFFCYNPVKLAELAYFLYSIRARDLAEWQDFRDSEIV